ncbi:MAG TPA: hypothetical protein VLA16_12720 [Ideonella sp.]|nr:hypothetical protein [Ideonella sp.]
MNTLLKIAAAAVAVLPALACAQANPAYVEKSKIVGAGNKIQLFGLPGKSTAGAIKYWDTTITLEIDANGKPTVTSATSSVLQAKPRSTEFVPGSYQTSGGTLCTLANSAFNGRTQFDLNCGGGFTATWYTGAIAGHPWETELVVAQLDTIVGHDEFAWGKTVFDANTTWFSCFNDPELLSARQVGDTLTLVNYGSDKVVECQIGFNKTP